MFRTNAVNHKVHLSYKDVLLVPYDEDFCTIMSRHDPDISTEVCPGKKLKNPIISSPMDSVTGPEMVVALAKQGSMGVLTRYINNPNELELQLEGVIYIKKHVPDITDIAVAMGVKNNVLEHASVLCDAGVTIICLDIANGNHILMARALDTVAKMKDKYNLSIIAGNVATSHAAQRLASCGADALKVGIGPGAACSTRRIVGFGVPQFTAVLEVANTVKCMGVQIIADGGVRTSGDVVKALWAGADTVMSGYIFAGHDECPIIDGKKIYRGMSSRAVHKRQDIASEGVSMEIDSKGSVSNIVQSYCAAIRSACSMANARNLDELRKNVMAIRVSTMSNEESEPLSL